MDTLGPVIVVTDASELSSIMVYRDWIVDEDADTAFHRPSQLLFQILAPVDSAFPSALVILVCDGRRLRD